MDNTELKLVITNVRDQARLTRSFDLRPAENSGDAAHIEFMPGQIAILSVPGEEPAYFAFASAPGDEELEVLVKQKVGASKVLYDMQEGDEIMLLGICGNGFDLDQQKHRDLVFVGPRSEEHKSELQSRL